MASPLAKRLALILAATSGAFAALDVDLTNADSIKAAAKVVATNLLTYYHGDEPGQTPGILPGPPPGGPYFWWEAGAMWGTLVDYWHYTNETTYNNMTTTSLVFQSEGYYQPANWTLSLGFDDQGFWAMSALLAAEVGYPDPPAGAIGWLALAQGVFNYQVSRWDTTFCNGGLPWQIPQLQKGYDYKNTIVTGIMFNMASRLAHYTRNDTYAQWAEKTWDWLIGVRYVDAQWNVYDGGHDGHNCTDINPPQFSYNAAVLTQGLAYLWAYTNTSTSSISSPSRWESSLNGLLNRTLDFFFPDGIMVEMPCEQPTTLSCTTDELSFKGYMHRWLATTTQLAPWTRGPIMDKLRTSAAGMVKACNPDGTCGFRWNTGGYDGNTGAGQEMSALAALLSLLVTEEEVKAPLTSDTGGTSKSDPNAGINVHTPGQMAPITSGDRAGAAILTALVLASFLGALWWLLLDETKPAMAMPKWWPGRKGG